MKNIKRYNAYTLLTAMRGPDYIEEYYNSIATRSFFCIKHEITARLRAIVFENDEVLIKNWFENQSIDLWLRKIGLIRPTGISIYSGYVEIERFKYTPPREIIV